MRPPRHEAVHRQHVDFIGGFRLPCQFDQDACFDRHGNIFVVEWVDLGRVMKRRQHPGMAGAIPG
jgi:hypothetical protein